MAASRSLFSRMIRAAKLEVALYEEVEADSGATVQAFLSVIIVSLASGIGAAVDALLGGGGIIRVLWGLFTGIFGLLIAWLLWSLITWIIGSTIFKGKQTSASWGELLRTIGFAFAPGMLLFFTFIPWCDWILNVIVIIWTVIAVVIAVRQALDFSTWRAIGTCIAGIIIYAVISLIINALPSVIGGGRLLY